MAAHGGTALSKFKIDPTSLGSGADNRFLKVLHVAAKLKTRSRELVRASLAEEFFRENPMPWLLDSEPVEEPAK